MNELMSGICPTSGGRWSAFYRGERLGIFPSEKDAADAWRERSARFIAHASASYKRDIGARRPHGSRRWHQ